MDLCYYYKFIYIYLIKIFLTYSKFEMFKKGSVFESIDEIKTQFIKSCEAEFMSVRVHDSKTIETYNKSKRIQFSSYF